MIKIEFWEGYLTNLDELCYTLNIQSELNRIEKENQVLIKGYEKWRESLPIYMKGYFSFSLWDEANNSSFGARDRFGVIPFYYVKTQSRIISNCYINKVINNAGMQKKLNPNALQIYLTFSFLPGEQTFYQNVLKLMPGFSISFVNNNCVIKKYHEFKKVINYDIKEDKYKELTEEIIKDILCNMETEDGAFFLSSGIDSNYLYSLSGVQEAFSIGYDNLEYDESKSARENAHMYNKKCERILLKPETFWSSVNEATIKMEQPVGTVSSIAFMNGCKEAEKITNICFSGEGADELFAGYEIYKKSYFFDKNVQYLGKTHIFEESEKRKILKTYTERIKDRNIVREICPRAATMDNLQYMLDVDINMWLEADSFVNSFKMSRAYNIEMRMPFINERLFDLAYAMPSDLKIHQDVNKYILRELSSKVLPEQIVNCRKRGFVMPIRKWLVDERYNADIVKSLNGEIAKEFFNVEIVNDLFREFVKGNQKLWRKIWSIYAFIKWVECNF